MFKITLDFEKTSIFWHYFVHDGLPNVYLEVVF